MESQSPSRNVASEHPARLVVFVMALAFALTMPFKRSVTVFAQQSNNSTEKGSDATPATTGSVSSQAFFSKIKIVEAETKQTPNRTTGTTPSGSNSKQVRVAVPLQLTPTNAPRTEIRHVTENPKDATDLQATQSIPVQLASPIQTASPQSNPTFEVSHEAEASTSVPVAPLAATPIVIVTQSVPNLNTPNVEASTQSNVIDNFIASIPEEQSQASLSNALPLIMSEASEETSPASQPVAAASQVPTDKKVVEIDARNVRTIADGLLVSSESRKTMPLAISAQINALGQLSPLQEPRTTDSAAPAPAHSMQVEAIPAPAATPNLALVVGDARSSWLLFEDPALQEMIERVIHQNPGLREAKARILQSRAMFSRATADLFPQVSATAQHGYRRFSQNGNAFVQDSTTTQGFDWYSSGFDTRWEVDLFGRLRGIRSAANFEALAAEESYRDVMITLIGDLMLSYVEYALATERIRIAQQNLIVQQDILELTRERLRIGEDGALSVAQAQTQVELTRASIPAFEEQRSVALNRLMVLQGMGSQAFDVPEYWGQQLPDLPANSPQSIDCELLARRPDVRSSRLLVSAQLERLGASKAEYYPQVFINGTISLETRDLDVWWDERSLAHNVGPMISLNLLDFGRIRSNIRSERAKYEQAVARYQQSVLDATEEVRNAMVGVERQRERAEGLSLAAGSAQSVIEMAKLEYKEGITNFQNVLDAQRQLLSIEDQRAVAHGTALISYARLFKALGGAWYESIEAEVPPTNTIELPAITRLPQ